MGLERAGWTTEALCEIDEYAQDVLSRRFDIPKKNIIGDIKDMRALPRAELVSAGFPCHSVPTSLAYWVWIVYTVRIVEPTLSHPSRAAARARDPATSNLLGHRLRRGKAGGTPQRN